MNNNVMMNTTSVTMLETAAGDELISRQSHIVSRVMELASVCVSLLAVFVNACVILVIFIGPRAFRSPTFYLICSLALADLLTGLTVITAFISPMDDRLWQRVALRGVAVACFSASINNLLIIAGERYVKIQNDRSYQKIFTNCNTFLFICCAWVFALTIFAVGPLLGWHCPSQYCTCPTNTACHCLHPECSVSFSPFTDSYLITGSVYYYVCLVLMMFIYIALFMHVRRSSGFKRDGSVVGPLPNHGPFLLIHKKREIKLTKILCVVMGAFFLCWLPVTTLFIFDTVHKSGRNSTSGSPVISMLESSFNFCLMPAMIHPLINPLIYSLKMPRMWSTFRLLAYALRRRAFPRKCKNRRSRKNYPNANGKNSCNMPPLRGRSGQDDPVQARPQRIVSRRFSSQEQAAMNQFPNISLSLANSAPTRYGRALALGKGVTTTIN